MAHDSSKLLSIACIDLRKAQDVAYFPPTSMQTLRDVGGASAWRSTTLARCSEVQKKRDVGMEGGESLAGVHGETRQTNVGEEVSTAYNESGVSFVPADVEWRVT